MLNTIKHFNTKNAPNAIGPYSQATIINGMIYLSGQTPINPKTGEIIVNNIEQATEQVLKNIKAILDDAGSAIEQVIKTTIFLKRITDFEIVNNVYEKYFSISKPSRSTVEIAQLPKNVEIEIEAIAVINE